jgi:hypothetical protein
VDAAKILKQVPFRRVGFRPQRNEFFNLSGNYRAKFVEVSLKLYHVAADVLK